jgi:hypothetical protein
MSVGMPGAERGVTAGEEAVEYAPKPAAFFAATLNV